MSGVPECKFEACPFEQKIGRIYDVVVGTEEAEFKDGIACKISQIDEGLRGGKSNGNRLGLYARVAKLEAWQKWAIYLATAALLLGIGSILQKMQ